MNSLTPFIPTAFNDPNVQMDYQDLVLSRLKDSIVSNIRMNLTFIRHFKNSDGSKLAESVEAYIENGTIIIHSEHAHFKYQNEGVRAHQMWYLLGKTIPLKGKDGKTVFRKVTLGSFLKGKWQHPGYEGKHYVEAGINMAMAELPYIMDEAKEEIESYMYYQRGFAA
jgi:hypothetical protein